MVHIPAQFIWCGGQASKLACNLDQMCCYGGCLCGDCAGCITPARRLMTHEAAADYWYSDGAMEDDGEEAAYSERLRSAFSSVDEDWRRLEEAKRLERGPR